MEKELSLTIIHNDQGEEGCLLTQDDMRQLLKNFRREAQLSFEALGKLCDIDPEILRIMKKEFTICGRKPTG